MKELDLPAFPGKINFVDANNVVVGFDTEQSCCESFGWFYAFKQETPVDHIAPTQSELDAYNFDPEFIHEYTDAEAYEGNNVSFKLVSPGLEPIYLHLYNHHNGYYSHGFTMEVRGSTKHEGSL